LLPSSSRALDSIVYGKRSVYTAPVTYLIKGPYYTIRAIRVVFKTNKRKKAIFPDWHLGAAQNGGPFGLLLQIEKRFVVNMLFGNLVLPGIRGRNWNGGFKQSAYVSD
jgi:hypothetical protein